MNNTIPALNTPYIKRLPQEIKGSLPSLPVHRSGPKGRPKLQWKEYRIPSKNDGLITCTCDIMNPYIGGSGGGICRGIQVHHWVYFRNT